MWNYLENDNGQNNWFSIDLITVVFDVQLVVIFSGISYGAVLFDE